MNTTDLYKAKLLELFEMILQFDNKEITIDFEIATESIKYKSSEVIRFTYLNSASYISFIEDINEINNAIEKIKIFSNGYIFKSDDWNFLFNKVNPNNLPF